MYNELTIESDTGIKSYIDDLNARFKSLLFKGLDGYKANHLGLARLDINGIPMTNNSDYEYYDGLMDDNYSLVSSFVESGDRKAVSGGFNASIDLIVSVNMNKFTDYKEEGIIKEVCDLMKVTSFNIDTITRDANALKGITYNSKVPDSMYPHFVFRIKSSLIII